MREPSELGLDHPDDGGGAWWQRAAIVAGANPFERGAKGLLVGRKLSIVRGGAFVYFVHVQLFSSGPRFAPGAFCFWIWNCCYRSLRNYRARLLVAAGARQPSKKLAQVVIGYERAASELAGGEPSAADSGVDGVAAEAGETARLRDAVRVAARVLSLSRLAVIAWHVSSYVVGRRYDGRWTTYRSRDAPRTRPLMPQFLVH
jgi:hypothetical protein